MYSGVLRVASPTSDYRQGRRAVRPDGTIDPPLCVSWCLISFWVTYLKRTCAVRLEVYGVENVM